MRQILITGNTQVKVLSLWILQRLTAHSDAERIAATLCTFTPVQSTVPTSRKKIASIRPIGANSAPKWRAVVSVKVRARHTAILREVPQSPARGGTGRHGAIQGEILPTEDVSAAWKHRQDGTGGLWRTDRIEKKRSVLEWCF